MPRTARKKSSLCINHVILRGVNQQIIFEDEYDYRQFISILKYYKKPCDFKLYAYCLMNNHLHLLMEHTTVDLDVIMKKLEVKFVKWYNQKYQRTGYLFQDRYKSEPINDMRYFLTVFRYIHQNPLHAGIETVLGTYPWSSFHDYLVSDSSFVDVDKILGLFPDHKDCIAYLQTTSSEKCLEHFSTYRLSDADALKIIQQKTTCNSPAEFQRLDLLTRNAYLKLLRHSGISVRQLSRLTGISRTAINNAMDHGGH